MSATTQGAGLDSGARPLTGRTGWLISDGKAGHEAQAQGVAEALRLDWAIKRIAPHGLGKLLAPWGPAAGFQAATLQDGLFAPPWPDIAIATGRQTVPYLRALRRRAGRATFTVALMDPRTGLGTADVIWVPAHDRLRGANVITTVAMPNVYSVERLAALRSEPAPPSLGELPVPRVAVLVGGPNGIYRFEAADIDRLIALLRRLCEVGYGLMITTSRRTPAPLKDAVADLATLGNVYVWNGDTANPYPQFVARADHFIVTADSVAMVSEAASTGRPVHIFTPSGGNEKFDRFHKAMAQLRVTRPAVVRQEGLASWPYPAQNAADTIAREIEARWLRKTQVEIGGQSPSR